MGAVVLVVIFFVAAFAASAVNLAVYRLRSQPMGLSPWNGVANRFFEFLGFTTVPTFPEEAPSKKKRKGSSVKKLRQHPERTWLDMLPIIGWWRISREEQLRGKRFWIRPFLVELALPIFLVWLYWWQVLEQAAVPSMATLPFGQMPTTALVDFFIASAILTLFMAAASLIDFDEFEIPDGVIIPGTVAGVFWACLTQKTALATVVGPPIKAISLDFVDFSSPNKWPEFLTQISWLSLALGIGCVCLWCFALMPRIWRTSRGFKFAVWLFFARLRRARFTILMLGIATAGSLAVWAMWQFSAEETWRALMSSLLGMISGALIIWTVRIVAGMTMGLEAMGFGDVTLMAMIGAFLGWQACVFVFFIAPFFALVPAIASAISNKTTLQEVPYGPFLCLGALSVMVFWRAIWEWGFLMFATTWFLPLVLALCVPMLAILLGVWRLARYLLTREADQSDERQDSSSATRDVYDG
ncbi:MAG: A24 family peptidase [Pirellulales bacterium]|nr:A24 family peptidase [Pirellulales bacterium]